MVAIKFNDKYGSEIVKLVDMKVIEIGAPQNEQFISPICFVPKPDGSRILNLKAFTVLVRANHFKMETLIDCLPLIQRDCYFASVDLGKAYYSVRAEPYRKCQSLTGNLRVLQEIPAFQVQGSALLVYLSA